MSTYAKSERTRQLIIEKSAGLFNRKGFAGTSLSDITEATNLTKGALYGHFADKEQLALSVFDYNTEKILSAFQAYSERGHTVLEKFQAILQFYGENYMELTRLGGCPFMNATVEFDDQPGLMKQRIKERFGKWEAMISSILEGGQQQGEIKHEVKIAQYVVLFISMIEGALLLTHLKGDPGILMACFEQIGKIIVADLAV